MTDLLEVFKNMDVSHSDEGMTVNGRVLIVDGLNTFIRSFAAIPTMDSNGNHVGGITGFLKSVGYAIRTFKPSRVFVVFDGKGGSKRRRDLYPEYKANRKPVTRLNRVGEGVAEPDDERNFMTYELTVLAQLLTFLPMTIITYDNVEADDVMAYLAELTVDNGGEAIIYSTDKDFLQLVSSGVKIWNPIRKKTYTPETVLEEYGIHPNNFVLYRAITGDKSDNIEGVKGVGVKTLLKEFSELGGEERVDFEKLMVNAAYSKSKTVRKLSLARDRLERNLSLMQLADANMSTTNKMYTLGKFESNPPKFDKLGLTKKLIQYNIMDAMGNYDSWVSTTFNSLARFHD